jgi:glycosidase
LDKHTLQITKLLAHPVSNEQVFAYRRESDEETITVILNFSAEMQSVPIRAGTVVVSTFDSARDDHFRKTVELAAGEGIIVVHH